MSKKNRPATITAERPRGDRLTGLNGMPKPAEPARRGPQPAKPLWAKIVQPLASLRLTVILMLMSMVLVYAGTLAQVDHGIWQVVDKYFWASFVWIPLKDLIPRFIIPAAATIPTEIGFPWLGGKLLGFLLLINLLAAHGTRFKLTWKRSGIWLIHGGLILLLVGEAVTRERAEEYRMPIEEGKSTNYLIDWHKVELAFVDLSDPKADQVAVLPGNFLSPGAKISNPALPVDVEVVRYMTNSAIVRDGGNGVKNEATHGYGLEVAVEEKPPTAGTDKDQTVDSPSVYLRLIDRKSGQPLGVWLLTTIFDKNEQRVDLDGKPYEMALRFRREYVPYTMHLTKFTHAVYEGTDTPKDFRSHVHLSDPETGTERDVEIYMNAPLRYRGKTFFQASFQEPSRENGFSRGTVLQVVDNPGWLIPYISCVVVVLGMLVHFSIGLVRFLIRVVKESAMTPGGAVAAGSILVFVPFGLWILIFLFPRLAKYRPLPRTSVPGHRISKFVSLGIAAAVVLIFGLYLVGLPFRKDKANSDGFDLEKLRRQPVLAGGRVQPMDTPARTTLRALSGSEEYEDADGKKQPAIKWFADVLFRDIPTTGAAAETRTGPAWEAPVFKIDNDQVVTMLGLKPRSGLRYSLGEFYDRWEKLEQEVDRAADVPKEKRDKYQTKLLEFSTHLREFQSVRRSAITFVPPTVETEKWLSFSDRKKEYVSNDRSLAASAENKAWDRFSRRHPELADRQTRVSEERRKELIRERDKEFAKAFDELETELDSRLATDPATASWVSLRQAYRDGDRERFNKLLDETASAPNTLPETATKKSRTELFFNKFAPFYQSMGMYVCAAVLCLFGLLLFAVAPQWSRAARWPAFGLTLLAFGVHTAGLITRMYLQGRPPVTNLYSSAIFIGWGAVLFAMILELFFSYGVANLVGAVLGFCTCLVAHYLSKTSGDTLEMMQAVLDTNFWLATHVTCVTLGYFATFFAGILGIVFLGLGMGTPVLNEKPFFKAMTNMLYGVICFATMLSFTGTVLGGIWADQSWGRFWGWDPKENGAVLVVIWNALVLHARWSGLVQQRGMAVLAVLGNIVTTWSWFGTNMLGVGLHSYGFSNELFYIIVSVSSVSLAIAVVGTAVHPRHWLSYGGRYDAPSNPSPAPA